MTNRAWLTPERLAALATAADCPEDEVAAIVDDMATSYTRFNLPAPLGWVTTAPLADIARWLNDQRWSRALTVHQYGMQIGEFLEDGRTVFVPAWANGSLDRRSIADTPRFATLAEAQLAVDGFWLRQRAWRGAEAARRAALAALGTDRAPAPARMAEAAYPEYDPTVCWECGGPILAGDGVLDDPMGWAHRSCIGA
jgi:hypothetical protein